LLCAVQVFIWSLTVIYKKLSVSLCVFDVPHFR
jgi:hypothetical protein